ncbi:putative DREPP family protein [Lupinus albus]|uniref:Putative DREPP family protein n=1 Tax=Lupinus albus TaxID=3870 RepID=A0A6A4NBL9_LUPAL|nr:putative DREPP family protein [Lupinus albus]
MKHHHLKSSLVKEHDEAGLKKHSKAVNKFLEELVKIDFPGSKPVSEASSKFGPALVSGPVFFVFEKVSTFIVTEEKVEAPIDPTETKTEEETSTTKEREIVITEEKKEEKPVVETIEKTESSEPPQAEPAKVEEQLGEPSKVEEKHAEVPTTVEKAEPPKP